MKGRAFLAPFLAGVVVVLLSGGLLAANTDQQYQHAADALSKGDLENAQRELEKILRKRPSYERAKTLLGLTHFRLSEEAEVKGDRPGAVAELQQALRLEPDEAYWRSRLAKLLNAQGDVRGAAKECTQAAKLSPDDSGLAAGCGLRTGKETEQKDAANQEGKDEADARVFSPGGDVRAPVPVHTPEPAYSDKARLVKQRGTLILWVVINAQGDVVSAAIVEPLGLGLDQNALRAIRTWKFTPATRNGQPVSVRVKVEMSFRMF